MIFRFLIIAMALGALACSTGTTGVNDQDRPAGDGHGAEPPKADRGQLTDIQWANQFFLTQIYDERFNPEGVEVDADSNNCGPASLAMLMEQRGATPSNLAAETAIDHARAMMYQGYPDIDPSSLSEGATLSTTEEWVLVDDDTHPVFFGLVDDGPSITQGIRSGGGTPVFGYSWDELNELLEATGAVIAHGHITEAWRGHFSSDYGQSSPGAVSHFVAVFPASTTEEFVVCDPMHRGGAVLMTQSELGAFFRSPVNAFETTMRFVAWDDAPPTEDPGPETAL